MHKNGWCHRYLVAGHNITLDGRLVDFDSVVEKGDKDCDERDDKESMLSALAEFFENSAAFLELVDSEFGDLLDIAEKAYREAGNNFNKRF